VRYNDDDLVDNRRSGHSFTNTVYDFVPPPGPLHRVTDRHAASRSGVAYIGIRLPSDTLSILIEAVCAEPPVSGLEPSQKVVAVQVEDPVVESLNLVERAH
jgi:hypothetical protein